MTSPIRDQFSELYIHEDVWNSEVALRARKILSIPAQKVSERPYSSREGDLSGAEFSHSKRRLYLSKHTGHFFKKCPGTFGSACCNYYVLNLGTQCHMNCSYCYLQTYINTPVTQIYTNLGDALLELEQIATRFPDGAFRVGTGETIDSLGLDDITHYSRHLVEWFAKHPKLTCEFKTKSNHIQNFIDTPHGGNVVVSWSVNPARIVAQEEHGTASTQERLEAARRVCDRGFPVAFHIDPMIFVPDWQEQYGALVDDLCEKFTPTEMKWVSVGALRYLPSMKQMLRERFGGKTQVLLGEMLPGEDGKLRYDRALRNEMFKFVIDRFRRHDSRYPVFLCMETPESWINTLGSTPRRVENVQDLFVPVANI